MVPVTNATLARTCPQTIVVNDSLTCQQAALQYQIPSQGLYNLNDDMFCLDLSGETLCAPLSCPITTVDLGSAIAWNNNTLGVANWVANYSNFTLTQFISWNPYIGQGHVTHGTTVCVGSVSTLVIDSTQSNADISL